MDSESKLLREYFAQREVTKHSSKSGDSYVAMVDGQWDLKFQIDPFDEKKPALLELDLGLLPFDVGKRIKAIRAILNWNHACLKRHGYGAALIDDGNRVVLARQVSSTQLEIKTMRKNLAQFIDLGRTLWNVYQEANNIMPANAQYL